jgi:hypothetical protein
MGAGTRYVLLILPFALVSLGCSEADTLTANSPAPTPPPVTITAVRLVVTGCSRAHVWYETANATTYPTGEDVTLPWVHDEPAVQGDVIKLRACNLCEFLPVTITTSIYWGTNPLASSSATGNVTYAHPCDPNTSVQAVVP